VLVLLPRIGYLGSAIMLAVSYILGITLSTLKARGEIRRRLATQADIAEQPVGELRS
jgi:hypothetical protein